MQAVFRLDLDLLARRDVLEDPEESIPVPGDAEVAALVGQAHAFNEAGAAIEVQLRRGRDGRKLEAEIRNAQDRNRPSFTIERLAS
jgi:hypothetical protein